MRRIVFWNDYNGSAFVLTAIPNRPLIIEDCDVIYARAGWHRWRGGRLFNMRGEGKGLNHGEGVIFRNIRVEDPRPTLQHFFIMMQALEPYGNPNGYTRTPGDLRGITFQDITIAAPSVLGEPDILWGHQNGVIKNIIFDNVTIAGEKITSLDHFMHNDYVQDIVFK